MSEPGPSARDRVAACLIVQNEEQRLPAALSSLSFCDEIIVVDGGSSDRTVEVARAAGARVVENPWPGFAAQRNVGIDAASSEWILEVDADERVDERLRASIEALLSDPPRASVAVFALRHRMLGGLLGPSGKYPAYRARLFRRGSYRHDETRAVHEGIDLRERPAVLAGDLEHELAGTVREALGDAWRYARLESRHMPAPASSSAYLKGIFLRPAMKFAYRLLIDGGWRDGWRGLFKITLDSGSDGLVWALALKGRDAGEEQAAERAGEHFGARRVGPLKVAAIAGDERSAREAEATLSQLRARGADVVLIAPVAPEDETIPQQPLARLRVMPTIQALELEMHVRPIDAVLPFGGRARRLIRLLPGNLRPQHDGLMDPGAELRSCE
ncbi:MAG TPA: glycosyltransferase family 2 protein [Solirubrobacteraceae bacterium]|jgi:hypothetical protein|nr:glycosyltransferase family 2 protein [Solirubrobacteraceae bacterium]